MKKVTIPIVTACLIVLLIHQPPMVGNAETQQQVVFPNVEYPIVIDTIPLVDSLNKVKENIIGLQTKTISYLEVLKVQQDRIRRQTEVINVLTQPDNDY